VKSRSWLASIIIWNLRSRSDAWRCCFCLRRFDRIPWLRFASAERGEGTRWEGMCESPFTRDRAKQGNGLVERQGASCPTSRDHMTLRESRYLDKFLSAVRVIALSALLVAPSSLALLALETSSSSDDQCRQRDGSNWPARCWERTHAIRGRQAQPCHFTREMRKKGTEPRGETKANGLVSDAGPSPRGTAPRDVAVPGSLAHVDPAVLPAATVVPRAVAAPLELAAADAAEPMGEAGAAGRSG